MNTAIAAKIIPAIPPPEIPLPAAVAGDVSRASGLTLAIVILISLYSLIDA